MKRTISWTSAGNVSERIVKGSVGLQSAGSSARYEKIVGAINRRAGLDSSTTFSIRRSGISEISHLADDLRCGHEAEIPPGSSIPSSLLRSPVVFDLTNEDYG